mmetsp:Transcript_13065/g.36064  ORF Transcript_13065/g.36064 Transcript_13065/m.36064 type:complete len:229 (-) Transcript_13065:388-1074(-)
MRFLAVQVIRNTIEIIGLHTIERIFAGKLRGPLLLLFLRLVLFAASCGSGVNAHAIRIRIDFHEAFLVTCSRSFIVVAMLSDIAALSELSGIHRTCLRYVITDGNVGIANNSGMSLGRWIQHDGFFEGIAAVNGWLSQHHAGTNSHVSGVSVRCGVSVAVALPRAAWFVAKRNMLSMVDVCLPMMMFVIVVIIPSTGNLRRFGHTKLFGWRKQRSGGHGVFADRALGH